MTGCVPAVWAVLATLTIAPAIMITVGVIVMMTVGIRPPSGRMIARVERHGYCSPIDWPLVALVAAMIPLAMIGLVVTMAAAPGLLTACVPVWQALAVTVGIGVVVGAAVGWVVGTDERLLEAVRIVATVQTVRSDERAVDYLAALIAEADAEIEETAGAELADEVEAWLRDGAR